MENAKTQKIPRKRSKVIEQAAQRELDKAKPANLSSQIDLQRVIEHPDQARPVDVIALRHASGNRAAHQLIQPKLVVGPASDSYESEADQVAEQVINAPATTAETHIQRQEDEEEVQTSRLPGNPIQRQEDEEEVQTKPLSHAQGGFPVDAAFEDQLKASKGHGEPLPGSLRKDMESRIGSDFQGVRVHHSSHDAELNRSISAQAFTLGEDIYMGAGKYDPQSTSGKRLLAHELTHVVQQSGHIGRKTHLPVRSRITPAGNGSIHRVQRMMTVTQFKEQSAITLARRGKTLRAIDEKLAAFDAIKAKLKPDLAKTSPLIAQGMQILMAIDDICRMWLVDHTGDSSRSKYREPAINELQRQVKTEIKYMQNTYKVSTLPTLAVSGKHQTIKDRFDATTATSGFEKIAPLIDWVAPPTKKAPPSTKYEEIQGSVDVTVDVPLGQTGGTLGFHINANVQRGADGLVKFGALVGVTGGYGYGIFSVKGELDGYIEAQAKSSNEVMRLFSFMLYRRARESKVLPHGFADLVWGGASGVVGYRRAERWAGKVEKDIFTGTTPDTYVESGVKAGVQGSAGDPFGLIGAQAQLQGSTGRRYDVQSLTSKGRTLGQQFARPVGKFYAPQPVQARSIETGQFEIDLRAGIFSGSMTVNLKSLGSADHSLLKGRTNELSFELYAHALVPFTGNLFDLIGPQIKKLCKSAYDGLVAKGITHTLGLKSLLGISTLPDPQLKLPEYIGKVFNAPLTLRLSFQTGKPPKLNLEYGFDLGGGGNTLIVGAQVKRSRVLKSAIFSGSAWAWQAD